MPDTVAPLTVPTGRFEWERIVRRIRMPKPVKLAALVLATYADPDGSRVRPGMEVLAAVTGDSERNAKRIVNVLRSMRLIEQVSRGGGRGGRGKAATYQLVIPTDLLERVELLGVGDNHPESGDTQMSPETEPQPVDNTVDSHVSGDTQMSPETGRDTTNEVTSGAPPDRNEVTFFANEVTSGCPTTTHLTNHLKATTPVVTTQGESRPRARASPQPQHPPPIPPAVERTAA